MSELTSTSRIPALLMGVGERIYALPVADVIETMRPLPVEPVANGPAFVRGLSIIRGEAVPVVDLGALLSESESRRPERLVLVKAGERRVALAVDRVIGLRELHSATLKELPPLLQEAQAERVQAVGRLDEQLLLVLDAARLLPEETP